MEKNFEYFELHQLDFKSQTELKNEVHIRLNSELLLSDILWVCNQNLQVLIY